MNISLNNYSMDSEDNLLSLDSFFMDKALQQANFAFAQNEVPVGAIVVDSNKQIISVAFNKMESKKCQSFHAEVIAIQEAARKNNDWRLNNYSIFVTLEPCLMCFGLIRQSRIKRLVFAAESPLFGFKKFLNDAVLKDIDLKIDSGLKEKDSLDIIKKFFKKTRTLEKN